MRDIPKDLYEFVHDLVLRIVNASMAEEEVVAESLYLRLRELYETSLRNGHCHPFLTETLADFTVDNETERVRLYKEAIDQCALYPLEPLHTKMFSLADILVEIGRNEEAEAWLVSARQHAISKRDDEAVRAIDSLQRTITSNNRSS